MRLRNNIIRIPSTKKTKQQTNTVINILETTENHAKDPLAQGVRAIIKSILIPVPNLHIVHSQNPGLNQLIRGKTRGSHQK